MIGLGYVETADADADADADAGAVDVATAAMVSSAPQAPSAELLGGMTRSLR